MSGLFELIKRIFNIRAVERHGVETWHKDVRFFDLLDEKDEVRGSFYLDLYAREHKRGGAWMDDCIGRRKKIDGSLQKPVAYLTCNFNRPLGDQPALFTHDEVTTLFHEFGHGLHHMLTQIDVADVAGINGVPWDAVELVLGRRRATVHFRSLSNQRASTKRKTQPITQSQKLPSGNVCFASVRVCAV